MVSPLESTRNSETRTAGGCFWFGRLRQAGVLRCLRRKPSVCESVTDFLSSTATRANFSIATYHGAQGDTSSRSAARKHATIPANLRLRLDSALTHLSASFIVCSRYEACLCLIRLLWMKATPSASRNIRGIWWDQHV